MLTERTEKENFEKYLQFDACQPTQMLCFLKYKVEKEKIDTADNMRPSYQPSLQIALSSCQNTKGIR